MKRVEINEISFKNLIDGVKHCVAKDRTRPMLQYIQINVKQDSITAYALDGYRAARVEIKNTCPIDEGFTCYIKPITVKVSKRGSNSVVIEQADKKTFVEVVTEYGVLRYGFNIPQGNYVDIEKVYVNARPHDRELGIQPRYVIDALKALGGIQISGGMVYCVLESKESNREPFIIRAKDDTITNEQLILPVRVKDNL